MQKKNRKIVTEMLLEETRLDMKRIKDIDKKIIKLYNSLIIRIPKN